MANTYESDKSKSNHLDFIIGTPFADRGTLKIAQLLQESRAFACLHPTSLINEIPVENDGINEAIAEKLRKTKKIVLSSHSLTWIVNLPEDPEHVQHMIYLTQTNFGQGQLMKRITKKLS